MRRLLGLAVLLCVLAACGDGGGGSDDPIDEPSQISHEVVSRSLQRFFAAGQYTFRSQAELDRAWSDSAIDVNIPASWDQGPPPKFDFSSKMVIGLSFGTTGPGGCSIEPVIVDVVRSGQTTLVTYRIPERGLPPPFCRFAQPWVLFLAVPSAPGQVSFQRASP
jgi:hypothetical protein